MTKQQLIKNLQKDGMGFIYSNFEFLTPWQRKELLLSALYVIGNNNLDDEYFNELEEQLED